MDIIAGLVNFSLQLPSLQNNKKLEIELPGWTSTVQVKYCPNISNIRLVFSIEM